MKPEQFDELFDHAFDQAASKFSTEDNPLHQPAWQQLQRPMRKRRFNSFKRNKVLFASSIAAFILFGSILFGLPLFSNALDPVKSFMTNSKDQINQWWNEDEDNNDGTEPGYKTPPPPPPPNAPER